MFIKGFTKLAVAPTAQISPEKYYELVHEKDPYAGALGGGVVGGITGAIKGGKGKRSKGALLGAGVGSMAGAIGGHVVGKALTHYQANKINRAASELHLRASPGRSGAPRHHEEDGEPGSR